MMVSVEEALALIEAECKPLPLCRVPLEEAVGLVLAEDVTSDVDSPPFDKAMMDGYAVRVADGDSSRQILEQVTAGETPSRSVTPGTAIRIMTGAPTPDGADAVVMVERTEQVDDTTVRVLDSSLVPGRNIMRLGESLRRGQIVLRKGIVIRPTEVGILAEVGCTSPLAVPGPSVAILATGNELVPVDETPTFGTIRNSNGPMLSAAVTETGAFQQNMGLAGDDQDTLRTMIERALAHDVAILSGGVSVGVLDLVPPTLEALGVRRVFHKVTMKPGKPTWFGVREEDDRRCLVFGLPGNPVSCIVCFELLVRPSLLALGGHGFSGRSRQTMRLETPIRNKGDRPMYRPAYFSVDDDSLRVTAIPYRGSADLAALAAANCLIVLPAGKISLAKGAEVDVVSLVSNC